MKKTTSLSKSNLCTDCLHRFRRVFIPGNIEDFQIESDDVEGSVEEFEDGSVIIFINICLISGTEIDGDTTIECNHFTPKTEECELLFNIPG